ncbi:AAA family ATPase [Candidatus Acetothermia bacterium]|nr:AAA family ATPase [Candidatus Acetothermia bacterium]
MITETEIRDLQGAFQRLKEAIGTVIVGHEEVITATLICLLCGGNLLLEGVPGLGKTLLVRTLASTLGLKFARIQFTPDLMPADIIGTNIITEKNGQRHFVFSPGPVFANVLLADEINRATPKTQSALLEAMEESTVTVGNTTHKLEEPFIVLATQNPIEMEGTYPLPEAQLDRFFFKVIARYPTLDQLTEITQRNTEANGRQSSLPFSRNLPAQVINAHQILRTQQVVSAYPLAAPLRNYVSRLVLATHPSTAVAPQQVREYVEYGASPRAALSLIMGAKAHAFLAGKFNVRIADLEAVFFPAMIHRIILNFKGEAEGIPVEEVLTAVQSATPKIL